MAIEFINPVTAGTVLVRSDIRSQNFVTGVSGWIIEADGDAEFNSIVIRGSTTTQGVILLYNGTPAAGNLIGSIAPTSGTDTFGNTYAAGFSMLNTTGNKIVRMSNVGSLFIYDTNVWANPASLSVSGTVASGAFATLLASATKSASTTYDRAAALSLEAGDSSPARNAQAILDSFTTATNCDLTVTGNVTAGNIESGTAQTAAPGGAPAQTTVSVAFSKTFTSTPSVLVTPDSSSANLNTSNIRWAVTNRTTTGFDIDCWRDTNFATNFCWFAHV